MPTVAYPAQFGSLVQHPLVICFTSPKLESGTERIDSAEPQHGRLSNGGVRPWAIKIGFFTSAAKREPWNKGKFTGAKPPLRPKHVWSIRSKLQAEGRARDLAMFNLAIDSKLRACDVVALKVEDVALNGYAADRATVRQSKTGPAGSL